MEEKKNNSEDDGAEAEDGDDDTGKSPREEAGEDGLRHHQAWLCCRGVRCRHCHHMVDSEVRNGQVMTIIEEAKAGHGHRRLGASNFDYSVVTAACDRKTVIKPIASFWAKKECVEYYYARQSFEVQEPMPLLWVQGGQVNATTAAYPFKVTQADTNKLGDDTFFCMAFDGSVDPSKIVPFRDRRYDSSRCDP